MQIFPIKIRIDLNNIRKYDLIVFPN